MACILADTNVLEASYICKNDNFVLVFDEFSTNATAMQHM